MVFKAVLIFVVGLIALISTIVCLILMVIGLANRYRLRFFWMGAGLVSLLVLVFTIFLFVHKTVNKIKSTAASFQNGMIDPNDSLNTSMQDNRSYLVDGSHSNPEIQRLQSYLPDSLKAQVPQQFYTYFGFQDYYRLPIRYPYALHAIVHSTEAMLYNERQVRRFDVNDNGEESLNIDRITAIAFDAKFLLASISQSETIGDRQQEKYLIFEFDTEKKIYFKRKQQMFYDARRKGYNGPDTLVTLREYDDLLDNKE